MEGGIDSFETDAACSWWPVPATGTRFGFWLGLWDRLGLRVVGSGRFLSREGVVKGTRHGTVAYVCGEVPRGVGLEACRSHLAVLDIFVISCQN